MLRVGDEPVPGYKLVTFLGRGQVGEVWKAVGPSSAECALRSILVDARFGLPEYLNVTALTRVNHVNLNPIYAAYLKDADDNILSENEPPRGFQINGRKQLLITSGLGERSLGTRLEEYRPGRGIPFSELLGYVADAAKGIDFLNAKRHLLGAEAVSILHCGIQPGNLLIVNGDVQVSDYGFYNLFRPEPRKTPVGGNLWYAPAELLNFEPCRSTDQYSLAIVYHELRTGELPFDENRVMQAKFTGELDLSRLRTPERDAIKRATDLDPSKRFASCQEMVNALRSSAWLQVVVPESFEIVEHATRQNPSDSANKSTPAGAPEDNTAPVDSLIVAQYGLAIPTKFRGYRLIRELGKGGMGVVFHGEDLRLGRPVAIKFILPEYANQPKTRARFLREAKSQANVVSDFVVGIHHIGEEGEVPYIVMPLLNGETLEDCLKREPVAPLSTTLQVGIEVASGLAAAHDRRLIHRDIKPSNIWLEANAAGAFHRCKILDFGLARPVDTAATPITVHHAILGTPAYMSAEQAGEDPVDHRTDVYSLGVVLYEMATGVQPFHSTNIVQTLIRVATAKPGPAINLNPKLPVELSDLIARMMSRNVGERPQSAAEVVEELRGIAARSPR